MLNHSLPPQFRNEGIDLTHNPEFTTCEFYQVRLRGFYCKIVLFIAKLYCLLNRVHDLRVLPGAVLRLLSLGAELLPCKCC